MIPYGRQSIDQSDIDAVVEVLVSDWLTQGPTVPAFEKSLTDFTGAGHAVAVNSATSALHVAYLALGLGQGDILWTSPITFVATANCALHCGASVDFVDIDPATLNMSVAALERKLEAAAGSGRLPKIVVPVHFAGTPCDMAAIRRLADRYGFAIVEDASHAIGATYGGDPIGRCTHSDVAVFSFHPVKIVTTGEGGAALTNQEPLAGRMRLLRTHGVTRDLPATGAPADPWYYEQHMLGLNYRMTDIHAALGLSQMKRLAEFVAARRRIAARYEELLADLPLRMQEVGADRESSVHFFPVALDLDDAEQRRRDVFGRMREAGVGVNVHYIPVHLQPYYRGLGFGEGDFPEAERYYRSALTLPVFPRLTEEQQDFVVKALEAAIFANRRARP